MKMLFGMILACIASLSVASCVFAQAETSMRQFPTVDDLSRRELLPDPFQFFWEPDRYVQNLDDWKARKEEMRALVCHYMIGEPILNYFDQMVVENVNEVKLPEHNATIYEVRLQLGPVGKQVPYVFRYYLPDSDKPVPVIARICPSRFYMDMESTMPYFVPRGYGLAQLPVGSHHDDLHPEISRNLQNVFACNVGYVAHYLKHHTGGKVDKVILTGHSRFGKAAIAGATLNESIDMVAPAVTGGAGVITFSNPAAYGSMSGNMKPFFGKFDRMPFDLHFCHAIVAPRPFLIIMGDEGPDKEQVLIEGYDAARLVYKWLGAEGNIGVYDHSPIGHALGIDDYVAMMDFADMTLYGKAPTANPAITYYASNGPDRLNERDVNATRDWVVPPSVRGVDAPANQFFAEAQKVSPEFAEAVYRLDVTNGSLEGKLTEGEEFFLIKGGKSIALYITKKETDLQATARNLLGQTVVVTGEIRQRGDITAMIDIKSINPKTHTPLEHE